MVTAEHLENQILERCFRKHRSLSDLEPVLSQAFKLSRAHFPKDICFSMPGMIRFETSFYTAINYHRFPSISVTGEKCQLNCEHCHGKILANMIPATSPKRLLEVCARIKEEGGEGCLISGGSLRDGRVPLETFVPAIKRIKRELDLDVVVHTGIVYPELAEALADACIDAAMIDIIGSNETIRRVYHVDLTVDAYEHSLSLLEQNNIPVVPHIVVGIHYGNLKGEERALQIISRHRSEAVIVVALMPLDQTPMVHVAPPSPLDITRVILASRLLMPEKLIMLGCARPGGKHRSETDILAIKAGVNGIAYPSEEGYNFAKSIGLNIRFSEECCALAYK